ncbi:MAG: START domain-containing protein [Bacteroidota bacterium]
MKNWLFTILITSFPLFIFGQTIGEWKLKKEKNDLKVYVRDNSATPIKELKMVFKVDASMSAIVELLQDVAAIPDWVYRCPKAYSIKKISDSEEVYYNLVDFPWPLDDRDLVVRNVLTQDPVTKVVKSESFAEASYIAEKEGIIRIQKTHLWWTFTPNDEGWIDVEYFLSSDPGGFIPAWIINLAIDQGPTHTIKEFKKILKLPKYRDAQLDFISEVKE